MLDTKKKKIIIFIIEIKKIFYEYKSWHFFITFVSVLSDLVSFIYIMQYLYMLIYKESIF